MVLDLFPPVVVVARSVRVVDCLVLLVVGTL